MKKVLILAVFSSLLVTRTWAYESKWNEIKLANVDAHTMVKAFDSIPRPKGIERIIALASQNTLLIRGTETALKELSELIALLDRPAVIVTLDCWLVQAQEKDLPQDAVTSQSFGDVFIGGMKGDPKTVLADLAKAGNAKILLQSQAKQANNTSATLLSVASPSGARQNFVICTANGDDTVTLALQSGPGLVNAKVRSGEAVVVTAPGFKRNDDMLLVIRAIIAK